MGKSYKSPAKINRSIKRLLEYKQAYLEDVWACEIQIDEKNHEIIWKASKLLELTLKKNTRIVETRPCYNPTFPALAFKEKLSLFQNMWKPDHASFNFFSCVHNHIKTKSIQCDNFCGGFSSPYCGHLAYFLSTNNWPTEA